jgi:biopolymer transport protein ExbD
MEKRKMPSIGAGSMADVAFLLLIFFLVATTIQTDTGLTVKLPVWYEDPPEVVWEDRNVLKIQINAENRLLVEDEEAQISDLQGMVEQLILKEAESPKKAIVYLQNDDGTSYDQYIAVYNGIKSGYNKIWDDVALEKYGQHYKDLKQFSQNFIRGDYPLVISEAEPSNVAMNK